MTYASGSWGKKAKDRAKKRKAYFLNYNRNRDPLKVKARKKVEYAVSRKRLEKKPCEICGEKKVQAHHHDYTKPLEVIWYCLKHHREAEKR